MSLKDGVVPIMERLRLAIATATTIRFDGEALYECAVRSALAKNFEINLHIAQTTDSRAAFVLTPALRGMCEDIIALKYIRARDGRDKIIELLSLQEEARLIDKQNAFFEQYRPHQPRTSRVHPRSAQDQRKQQLFELDYKTPNVITMAEKTGLLSLYNYLYEATSSHVHFRPRNLLRCGWIKGENVRFSTEIFSGYYDAFNRFYGMYLFIEFCAAFSSFLGIKDTVKPEVDNLTVLLDYEIRWPELVTVEEQGIRKRSDIIYILSTAAHRCEGRTLEWDWE